MPKFPWNQFCPGRRNASEWQSFDVVAHITHVANAISVLEDRCIEPRLVYDESILRKRRIEVVWLSPNRWVLGYRYGHIAFHFRWADLIRRKRFYWVESIKYSPPACRILITEVDRSSRLQEYDPERRDGPWWFDRKASEHFWNGRLTMEFMFEGEVLLDECLETRIVAHHPQMCCLGAASCRDINLSRHAAGAAFLALALSRNLDATTLNMTRQRGGKTRASADLIEAAEELIAKLGKIEVRKSGRTTRTDARAIPLARAVLLALANRTPKEARALAELFASPEELQHAAERLLRLAFQLDRVAPLDL